MSILVINAGSSSVKFGLFRFDTLDPLARGLLDWAGTKHRATLTLQPQGGDAVRKTLKKADKALVLLGNMAGSHTEFAAVRELAAEIAKNADAAFGTLSPGANSAGLSQVGVLPYDGAHAGAMLDESLDAVVLLNVEPDADMHACGDAVGKLAAKDFVVALTPFVSDALLESADLLLPIGTFAETSGTYVNVEGTWQSFAGAANPVGEARPAWKVLRVLGNLVEADDFDYVTSEDVLEACRAHRRCFFSAPFCDPFGDDVASVEEKIQQCGSPQWSFGLSHKMKG